MSQVQRFGDSRVALIGFPSAGTFGSKLQLLSCMFEEYMACVEAMVCKLQLSPAKFKLHFDVEELHQAACKLDMFLRLRFTQAHKLDSKSAQSFPSKVLRLANLHYLLHSLGCSQRQLPMSSQP